MADHFSTLFHTFDLVNHQRSEREVSNRHDEKRGISEVIGETAQELQYDGTYGNADYLGQNAHRRPYAQEFTGFIRWRQHIGSQGPVYTGICTVSDTEECSRDQRPILTLKGDEDDAHNRHHRSRKIYQSLAPSVIRYPTRDNRRRKRRQQEDGK